MLFLMFGCLFAYYLGSTGKGTIDMVAYLRPMSFTTPASPSAGSLAQTE